jgi:cytochrome c-type biogenesis protein CcmH
VRGLPNSIRFPAKAGIQGVVALTLLLAALGPRLRGGALLVLVALLAIPATAQDRLPPAPYAYQQLKDPAQEARAKALMEELRCLVCQGQSIADSDAPLAGDMRHEVRSKIAAGESPAAIKAWLVARYGNWVSYDPPFDTATALLWLGPLLFLAIGGWLAFGRFRSGDSDSEDAA